MAKGKGLFYGSIILPVAWILYGFGISPAYYAAGQFAPELKADLGLTDEQWGYIWGAFNFVFSAMGPVAAYLVARFSVRFTMTAGALICSSGFFYMSRADSLVDCVIGLTLLGGIGIGLSTILPSQTLGQNWFFKYRARAIAIILTAGGAVGAGVPFVAKWLLEHRTWNDGWLLIAAISAVLAVLAFFTVRDRPEDMGQFRDGADEDPAPPPSPNSSDVQADTGEWTARQAIRSIQFAVMILCGLAYSLPWSILNAHGRSHLQTIDMNSGVIAGMFTVMIFISIFGRLSASMGDLISPPKVLSIALFIEAIGLTGFLLADGPILGYASVVLVGIGYGAGYVGISVVFTDFFGRNAFAGTTGTRFLIGGFFAFFAPGLAGRVSDQTGSFTPAFVVLAALCLVGSVAAFLCPRPGAPPSSKAIS